MDTGKSTLELLRTYLPTAKRYYDSGVIVGIEGEHIESAVALVEFASIVVEVDEEGNHRGLARIRISNMIASGVNPVVKGIISANVNGSAHTSFDIDPRDITPMSYITDEETFETISRVL